MVILGFIAGLALPRLENIYSSFQLSMQRSEVLRCIADLGYQAWTAQQELTLTQFPQSAETDSPQAAGANSLTSKNLPFPTGWSVVADVPIHYQRNGICSGGKISIAFDNIANEYYLTPPFCIPE